MATSLEVIGLAVLVSCGGAGSAGPSTPKPVVAENSTSIATQNGSAMMDHDTELSTAFAGLAVEQAYIIDGNDKKITGNKVALHSNFSIVYEGVKTIRLKTIKRSPIYRCR